MTSTPCEIGTLIVVVLKARNLPNKRHIGKQDPYCCVQLNGEKRRTKAIKRGGQHPEWDEEVRFTLVEDVEDELLRTANGDDTPPPPPPKGKDDRRKKSIKGTKSMRISCYADDPKEPDLIGEAVVDLTEVLTKGETDEWFTVMNKDKYCGEVYLELTFWSNEKPPEKKAAKKAPKPGNQYGGPGSFTPSADSGGSHLNANDEIPASLRASSSSLSSLAQLDLYIPPYENHTATDRKQGSGVDQIADEFGSLGLGAGRRRESFPPEHGGYNPPPPSDAGFSTIHTQPAHYRNGYSTGEYSEGAPSYAYDPVTPTARSSYRHTSISGPHLPFPEYQPQYQQEYDSVSAQPTGYSPMTPPGGHRAPRSSLPPVPSGFSSVPTPAPSGFIPVQSNTPAPSGFGPQGGYSGPPSGYAPPPSHTPSPSAYQSPHSRTPASSGFMTPGPPPSAMGFHPQHTSQQPLQPYNYQTYPPPSASAPPQSFPLPGPPPSVPPPSHSAPPQQFQTPGQPPPPPPLQSNPQQYPSYTPTTPSPPHQPGQSQQQYNSSPTFQNAGSRPLPQPGQLQHYSSLPVISTNRNSGPGGYSPPGQASNMPSNVTPYNPSPTPLPPPQFQQNPSSQSYDSNGYVPNPPPPPPPSLPPPQHYQQNSNDGAQGRPALPQPPTNYQPRPSSSYQAIPPPPPPPPSTLSQHQHYALPQPPPAPPQIYNGQSYYSGPSRPPVQPHEISHWST